MSKALVAGSTVYVSGNWYADDNVMDFYSGSTFSPLGNMDGRSSPYLFVDVDGNIISLSAYGTKGESFGFHTYDDGSQALLADKYIPSSGKTQYLGFPFTPQSFPMMLTDDVRPSDYHFKYNGENYFLLLLKQGSKYELQMFNSDTYTMYGTPELDIPVKHPVTNETITWRGGVIVNETRQEVYLIGTSGSVSDQTLHIISYNYVTAEWTIASVPGFNHNMLTASWTLLADGRLACTGGGIHDNTDAQRSAYLITPPVAGHSGGDNPPSGSEPRLVVWMKAGDRVTYDLADNPVTTFSGSQLVIRTNNLIITYERKDVLRYTYENVTYNGIDMMPGERRVQVNREGDEVTFRGLTIGSTAYIYSVNGTLLEQHEVTDSQPLTVSLHNRPNGVYIVKAGTETIKVLRK